MKMNRFLRQNALLIATVTSVVLGVLIGVLCRPLNPSSDTILLVGFPGEIFLRMLKMLMLPLIVASIITGVGSLKGVSGGRIGIVSILYYATSSLIALLIALALGLTIRPGAYSNEISLDLSPDVTTQVSGLDILLDLFRNMIPDNIVGATIQHSRTVVIAGRDDKVMNASVRRENSSEVDISTHSTTSKKNQLFDGANILGLLLYCVVFGIILSRIGRQGFVVGKLFAGVNKITLQMIKLVMWYSPVGIMFIVASQVMSAKHLSTAGHILGIYIVAEFSGLAIHLLVALPIFYFILTRENAFKIYLGAMEALLTALATSSSAAALPLTMRCVEKRLNMDARIASLVLPIGTTVNMDGGAVFAVMGPVFIALHNGVTLSLANILIISLTALLSSVGSAGVPGAGLSVLLLVLKAIELPERGIAFLLTVDWFMDRFRTVVNVASDCLAVGVTSHFTVLPAHQDTEMLTSQETTLPELYSTQTENAVTA